MAAVLACGLALPATAAWAADASEEAAAASEETMTFEQYRERERARSFGYVEQFETGGVGIGPYEEDKVRVEIDTHAFDEFPGSAEEAAGFDFGDPEINSWNVVKLQKGNQFTDRTKAVVFDISGKSSIPDAIRTCLGRDYVVSASPRDLGTPAVDPKFVDVASLAWYQSSVAALCSSSIMCGYGGYFRPYDQLTRAEAATAVYRLMNPYRIGLTVKPDYYRPNETEMTDVEEISYYTAALNWAVAEGVVTGDVNPDGTPAYTFRPDDPVSREEFAAMIHRALGEPSWTGIDPRFSDAAEVSEYAIPAVAWAVERGVLSGDENEYGVPRWTLRPADEVTRAEAAAMLSRTRLLIIESQRG